MNSSTTVRKDEKSKSADMLPRLLLLLPPPAAG